MRGRDIKRYEYNFADLWLIATFPSKKYDINDFPAIKNHLLSFGIERLEQTGKTHIVNGTKITARKKTMNKWFETQDSISYWDDFSKQKIMYNDICQQLSFCLVPSDVYCVNTVYFIKDNPHIVYLLACLNSNIINWYYRTLSVQLGESAVRMFSIYVLNIAIPQPTKEDELKITQLVQQRMQSKELSVQQECEREIEQILIKLYHLSQEEMSYINHTL